MAPQPLTNPFADNGRIVSGARFVGRAAELLRISQRVEGAACGNLSIVGFPRVGKSSLAWRGLMDRREHLHAAGTIPVYCRVGIYTCGRDLFRSMAGQLMDELEMLVDPSKPVLGVLRRTFSTLRAADDPVDFNDALIRFYRFVKMAGYRTVFILDEFDGAQAYTVADFQLLRELSISPDADICIVTCSRKTIREIEASDGSLSNFFGTFSELRLGMYSDDDMRAYWERVAGVFDPSDRYKREAEYFVGRHPFLLDVYNEACFNSGESQGIGEDSLRQMRLLLVNNFISVEDTLRKEGLLDAAVQLVLGPVFDVSALDEERLLKYDFLRKVGNAYKEQVIGRCAGVSYGEESFMCFSDFFTLLFQELHKGDVAYWPLWGSTEQELRTLVTSYLEEAFGSDWEVVLCRRCGEDEEWSKAFAKMTKIRRMTMEAFPNASDNIVDYASPMDMWNLFIAVGWGEFFRDVFGSDKDAWRERFAFLAVIRNPYAHNNYSFVTPEQSRRASDNCNMILQAIRSWGERRQSRRAQGY